MNSTTHSSISWKMAIDALERQNYRAFDSYYHFHSTYGIKERNLSPYERLLEIGERCESTGSILIKDFVKAIADEYHLCNKDYDAYLLDKEGFHFAA